jgi:glycosyltransferase involved in cell wall biosynthesis
MKILHILRENREGVFSIEQIFQFVRQELSEKFSFSIFQPKKFLDLHAIQKVKSELLDVNHITGDVNYLMYGLQSHNSILTVHDIGHYTKTLKGLKKKIYGEFWFNFPLRKATYVTAISAFTAQEIHHNFGIPYSKIEIIHDPLLPIFNNKIVRNWGNDGYIKIMQIGSGKNKNIERLIHAISGLNCKLILIRKPDKELANLLLSKKILYDWKFSLTQKELVEIFSSVDILYFASTYEGFGMPIIEAQALGIPVITSSVPPMDEISGVKGALLVNPFSVQEIRKAIKNITINEELRKELIISGYENILRFELGKISKQYSELYEHLNHKG